MTNDMDKKKSIFANNLNILIILLGALLIVLISFKGGLIQFKYINHPLGRAFNRFDFF